jgi:hypothetical protein
MDSTAWVDQLTWRTSTFSGGNGGGCVEVAPLPDGIAVRDTKDRTRTPHTYSRPAWESLLAAVRAGEFAV